MIQSLPGLFDLQVNGFAGVDYNRADISAEDLHASFVAMRATGVTRCLPTLITSSFDHFAACARKLVRCDSPLIAGLHMEGPYFSPHDGPRGAHPLAHVIAPSIEDFQRRQDVAEGHIRLVTLAPETDGALPLIEYLVEHQVLVAIGHSAADAACIHDAVTAGARLSTHLGNGCHGTMDRHRNVLWPQLADDRLTASLIADGFHLPDDVLRAMLKAKGVERSILVTDAMCGAAAPPGSYTLGDIVAEVDANGRVSQPPAGNLAGSALTMDRAVTHAMRVGGLSLADAWACGSTRPAALLQMPAPPPIDVEWEESSHQLTILPPTT
ncbi:N-acetylglucosamine-6-phosphate deacetylase [Actomonas aquatica]|uniref:N-acetylglucosamine-6-phosphate deacetylase n=1 Tax=Actomonas aquatica TaxID=2866162 RepID=A0ABZ1C7R2_9BACT|nr:N-acetylglucosamine-6-phosphate deacetylase [Opitutus sp. WL0086]WRQ87749.1 N-acetylglucosamine-6-phosphate deacetylase [Opitutus sp. WL0086]